MAVKTLKSIVYHIPKCGGIWVKEAFRYSIKAKQKHGPVYWRARENGSRQYFGMVREHSTPSRIIDEDKEGLFAFCFVRHPVSWYRSYWCYRIKTGYLDKKFPLDNLWDDDYNKFMEKVLRIYPDGFVWRLYQCYTGANLQWMDYIGKQENLAFDLIEAMKQAGEDFDEAVLIKTKWRNAAASTPFFRDKAILDENLEKEIIRAEKWVIDTFYV